MKKESAPTQEQPSKRLLELLRKMTGQEPTGKDESFYTGICNAADLLENGKGLGYSQLNELLLLLGYDRVSEAFFLFVCGELDSTNMKKENRSEKGEINSFQQLERGISELQKLSLLHYGNIKFGFKQLSHDKGNELFEKLLVGSPILEGNFETRHSQIMPVTPISREETHYLGYITKKKITESLSKTDPSSSKDYDKLKSAQKIGRENLNSYLASDHMDVYVATSMRESYEFVLFHDLVREIFDDQCLNKLNIRYFDPTQSYCKSIVDKGLSESLMLKRARCTVYFAQESDTLGKDSELATTLAQGKPVIAFVPEGNIDFARRIYEIHEKLTSDEIETYLKLLQIYDPQSAWTNETVIGWLNDRSSISVSEIKKMVEGKVSEAYDKRARLLKTDHPLKMQVNLQSGVANGVLVVRSTEDCAKLLRSILLREMKFLVEEIDGQYNLVEDISKCVYRVMSSDTLLTNAFWNHFEQKSTS